MNDIEEITRTRATFTRWLGAEYDLIALDTVLAAAAVEQLDGDPVWLLVISGSGNAKTETVVALAGADAIVTSTINSEGALLSATAAKETAKGATGGLLRRIGKRGTLVIKDFTSILSMSRDARAAVLAALREVYDGSWERNVGTDGGRSIGWNGRITVVGATTTKYDSHHEVIAAMGDRFALVRMDSSEGRMASGEQAMLNIGHEVQMRAELKACVGDLLASIQGKPDDLDRPTMMGLLKAANIVTQARTAVERDNYGNVLYAHAPEMPTRFAKVLGQLVRGCVALGTSIEHGEHVSMRVARDCLPPLRLLVLRDLHTNPAAYVSAVAQRVQRPRKTIERSINELYALGLVEAVETPNSTHYSIAKAVDRTALARIVEIKTVCGCEVCVATAISGHKITDEEVDQAARNGSSPANGDAA